MATAIGTRIGGPLKELTVRGIILGALITVIFTAANVYLGLKIGITFATSIPAAVISMAILRAFRDSTIQENNIVQTIASAAGTLSAIIFVLPGLIMVGWWTGFPYWLSVAVIGIGHLVGIAVGAAMIVGMLISWVFVVPYWSHDPGLIAAAGGDLDKLVSSAFKLKARMVGAGTIGVAAIWTLLRIIGPIVAGIRAALAANRERKAGRADTLPITERDIPIGIVTATILVSMI